MKQNIILLVVLLLSINLVGSQNQEHLTFELNTVLNNYYNNKEFNGIILIAKKGAIVYQSAFGFADFEKKIKNKIDTKFLIGSATKSFTAIAIMQAKEQGLLELHEPIKKYIPELNKELGDLTLHLLMKNSSGLPEHLSRITDLQYRDITSEELIDLYNTISLSFKPGSKYE